MDLQVKLVDEGHAMAYKSPEAAKLPAVGELQERGLRHDLRAGGLHLQQAPRDRRPRSRTDHASFAKIINANADKFKGKVTTYDIEKSGVGFMFVVQDYQVLPAA